MMIRSEDKYLMMMVCSVIRWVLENFNVKASCCETGCQFYICSITLLWKLSQNFSNLSCGIYQIKKILPIKYCQSTDSWPFSDLKYSCRFLTKFIMNTFTNFTTIGVKFCAYSTSFGFLVRILYKLHCVVFQDVPHGKGLME